MSLLRSGGLCEKILESRDQTQDTAEPDMDCSCSGCAASVPGSIGEAAVTPLVSVVALQCWVNDPLGLVGTEGA